jgi:transcriptional regulator with XRE-family HTH domain
MVNRAATKVKAPRTPEEWRGTQTLSAAASRLGVSMAALRGIEAGARGVTVSTLERCADAYGANRVEFYAGCLRARGES